MSMFSLGSNGSIGTTVGSSTFYSNGTTAINVGNTSFHSDGSVGFNVGGGITINSDGTTDFGIG